MKNNPESGNYIYCEPSLTAWKHLQPINKFKCDKNATNYKSEQNNMSQFLHAKYYNSVTREK